MLSAGVIGAGHLGKIHLKLLNQSERYKLIGFYDSDPLIAQKVQEELGYKMFSSFEALLDEVDVLDIVCPTVSHHQYAMAALKKGKAIFIEKPLAQSVEEAKEIEVLAIEKNISGQVGHVERFNPAFLACESLIDEPKFIEAHRLAIFNPRGTDVSVVLDLMIHDIDIVLHTIKSDVVDIQASGVSIISSTPDIANVRLAFANGAVANLTASRLSMKNMRKIRFFQKDAYISVDFNEKSFEDVRISDASSQDDGMVIENFDGVRKKINFSKPELKENNAILSELESFADAIEENKKPVVSLSDGRRALEVAQEIIEKITPTQDLLK